MRIGRQSRLTLDGYETCKRAWTQHHPREVHAAITDHLGKLEVIRYVMAHWRGQQSLAWSFWVNLVGLRVLIFTAHNALSPGEGQDYAQQGFLVIGTILLFHGLLLVWQLVGVVRAAENHFTLRGNMALVWAAQLGAVLMFLLTAVYALDAFQWTHELPVEEDVLARMAREHASQYQLSVSPSGQQLNIEGSMESGISRAVREMLKSHPLIRQVNLTSPGGNVYEGRALAKLFREHQLDTRTEGICASACTTAYTGGAVRSASVDAALGFHQYRIDASYAVIVVDVQAEQKRDAALFHEAGVSPDFVETLFNKPPGDMWWPSQDELLRARMIHTISP